jgi:NAD(P)-dependent dehydrogenase (short-subunit alcohol dehydrogenase family)
MKLHEMTVLVTGAASGIGHALSRGFLNDGATVVAVDRNNEGLEPLANQGAITLKVDVSDPAQVEGMMQTAVDKTGRLDVLFNNAGVGFRSNLLEHKPDQFEELIRINLFGPVYGMRYAIPIMNSQKFGRIINLVSRVPEFGAQGMSAYGSSKAALWAATRHVANEVIDVDILINGLIPGPTKSGMMPKGQDPSKVYPTACMLATLPTGGPSGKVFWDQKEYRMFDLENEAYRP